jgi:DNA-binding transcriptional regulator GbsR (MarR family)
MDLNYSGMMDNIYSGNNIYMGHNMTSHDNMQYEYIIDNLDNSALTCDYDNNENVNEIRKIRNNITNIFNCDPSELNASLNDLKNASDTELVNEFTDFFDKFIKEYLKEQDNYLECEKNLINEKNESKTVIKKLDIVIDFMKELSNEDCDDGINSTIIENIKEYSKQKENGDRLVIAKNEYYNSRLKINKFLEVIKKINSVNTTNTCPTCLSNSVSIYLNPCGHTMCDDCYERISNNNNDRKCFLCRARVLSKFPLYFS